MFSTASSSESMKQKPQCQKFEETEDNSYDSAVQHVSYNIQNTTVLEDSVLVDDSEQYRERPARSRQLQRIVAGEDFREESIMCFEKPFSRKQLGKTALIIVGLGLFVGLIDYFLVSMQYDQEHHVFKTNHGIHTLNGVGQLKKQIQSFPDFLAFYGKSYQTHDEWLLRREIFDRSILQIASLRAVSSRLGVPSFNVSLNEFADWTDEEWVKFSSATRPLPASHDDTPFFDMDTDREIQPEDYYVEEYVNDSTNHEHSAYDDLADELEEEHLDNNNETPHHNNNNPYERMEDDVLEEAEREIEDEKHHNGKRRLAKIPDEFDLRDQGIVSRVKRQGKCGACWAISTAGALEGAYALWSGKLHELSEQHIMDCASQKPFKSLGCEGGYISEAFKFTRTSFIALRDNYPYLGLNATCRTVEASDFELFIEGLTKATQKEIIQFWAWYYQKKFETELKRASENGGTSAFAGSSDDELEKAMRHFIKDNYQVPTISLDTTSGKDRDLDWDGQWSDKYFEVYYDHQVYNIEAKKLLKQTQESSTFYDETTGKPIEVAKNIGAPILIRTKKFYRLWGNNPDKMKKRLNSGPVTVMVNSQAPSLKYYDSGVIDSKDCEPKVDHAMLAVGYGKYTDPMTDEKKDYVILKNSWGRYWGERGYVRITMSRDQYKSGMCGIFVESYYPVLETGQNEIDKLYKKSVGNNA